jgi:hypothetical protein
MADWSVRILRRKGLTKHIMEGKIGKKIEVTERRGKRRKRLLDELQETEKMFEVEIGSTRMQSVENSLWKSLRTCRKRDYIKNEQLFCLFTLFRYSFYFCSDRICFIAVSFVLYFQILF